MTREETKELIKEYERCIKVMQHFVDGGEVERSSKRLNNWELTNNAFVYAILYGVLI